MKAVHENISMDNSETERKHRERIELLRSRVRLLSGEDRILMAMYIEKGNSFRQMARLAGVSEASIARRIRKITERLMKGGYITCLQSRDMLSRKEMDIAKDYLLAGLPIRKIADRRFTTYYRVRKALMKIQRIIKIADGE